MIIDILTERYTFADKGTVIPFIFYILASFIALTLRRWGQCRAARKQDPSSLRLRAVLLRDGPSATWATFFFLLTGCLKGPLREEERSADRTVNRKAFRGGIVAVLLGWIVSLILHILFQLTEWSITDTILMATKALSVAHLSLLIFSLLPLPCSDTETLLIQKQFGKRGTAFRKNGTYPFFLFTALALFLAIIVISVGTSVYSLSGIITMFPLILIGG